MNGTIDMGAYENQFAPYIVDSLEDTVAVDGVVTLREAIEAANSNAAVGDAHAGSAEETDVIAFSPDIDGGTITLENLPFVITESLDIRGPGANALTIDASNATFGFVVNDAGDVSMSGITIRDSRSTGVYSFEAVLTFSDCVLRGCRGSGIHATGSALTVTNSIFLENQGIFGGGIQADETSVNISGCSFTSNAANDGGAISAIGGSLTITNCSIADNVAVGVGGGISSSDNTVTLVDSTISGNSAVSRGGGIRARVDAMTIQNSVVSENVSESGGGGGISFEGETLLITDSTISDNLSGVSGGGLACSASGTTVLTNCSVVDNIVEGAWYRGGGINGNRLHLSNCTVSGNRSSFLAGGISAYESLTLVHSTVTDNHAVRTGGLWSYSKSEVTLFNSVVAQNLATEQSTNCAAKADSEVETGPDLGGGFHLSGSHNFIGVIDGISGLDDDTYTQYGTAKAPLDPMLGPLDYYGGPTPAHLPLPGSPLLDAGDNTVAVDYEGNPLTTDQRGDGFPRIAGGVVDLGALEASSHYLYIVNSPGDTIAEDGLLTLREAIEAISTGTQVGDAPAPIQLSGDYPLFIRFDDAILGQTITLAQGDLDITESVWIQGPGAELLTIDAGGEDRAFAVQEAGNVWISGLTIENGASGSNQGGGGIWAYDTDFRLTDMVVRQCGSHAVSVGCGTLSLADSTFLNNPNGAIIVRGNADDPSSSHNIVNCLFDNNGTGWNRGGAVYSVDASVLIVNSRFQGNRTEYGGAVYAASGEVEIVNSAFTGNTAERGGAVYGDANATITITNSTLAGNAASEGAGIYMYGDGDLKLQSSILFHDGQTEVVYDDGAYSVEDMLIGVDPRFVRNPSDGGDGWGDNPQTPSIDESANDDYGDLRLRLDSPALDEGDNDLLPPDPFDLDGDGDVSETLPVDLAGTPANPRRHGRYRCLRVLRPDSTRRFERG